nr:hypothetical protein [uncultured Flavobacterium sp.]
MDIQTKIKVLSYLRFIPYFNKLWANKVLESASTKIHSIERDTVVERFVLKGRILRMVKKFTNANAKSKFIKGKIKNNAEIHQRVLAEFGNEMIELGLILTPDLVLKDA